MLISSFGGFGNALGSTAYSWTDFLEGRVHEYESNGAYCLKDSANRPVCRRTNETTASGRRVGDVAKLQAATDRLINQIPAFKASEVVLVDGSRFYSAFEESPILKRSGYDGVIGPSTHGWINGALILATALAAIPENILQAVFSPTEAIFTSNAAALAAFFDNVTDNMTGLLAAYKARPRALPQLAPETIEIVREVVTTKKRKVLATGAVVALGGAGLAGLAAYGISKSGMVGSFKSKSSHDAFLMGTRSKPKKKRKR